MTSSLGPRSSRGASMIQVWSMPGGAMRWPLVAAANSSSRYAWFWSSRAWHQWWTIGRFTGSRPTRSGPGGPPRWVRASAMSAAGSDTELLWGDVANVTSAFLAGQETVLVFAPRSLSRGWNTFYLSTKTLDEETPHARSRDRRRHPHSHRQAQRPAGRSARHEDPGRRAGRGHQAVGHRPRLRRAGDRRLR